MPPLLLLSHRLVGANPIARRLATDPHRAIITENCTAPYCTDGRDGNGRRHVLAENAPVFIVDSVKVSLYRKTLYVDTGKWVTSSASTVGAPHRGTVRMKVEIGPTNAVDNDPVAPHGLIGQTFDRDELEVNGRRDDYSKIVRRRAARRHARRAGSRRLRN